MTADVILYVGLLGCAFYLATANWRPAAVVRTAVLSRTGSRLILAWGIIALTINAATGTGKTASMVTLGAGTLITAGWTTNATHETTQTKPPHFDESWRP